MGRAVGRESAQAESEVLKTPSLARGGNGHSSPGAGVRAVASVIAVVYLSCCTLGENLIAAGNWYFQKTWLSTML